MEVIILCALALVLIVVVVFFIGLLIGVRSCNSNDTPQKDTQVFKTLGKMQELSNKHEQVDENLFVLLAENDKEFEFRKELVDKYGYRANATFFSDGSVFVNNHGKGVTGWVGRTPPVNEVPPT